MGKKILISCTQHPYYGGAATNSYALIKFLRDRGHNVAGLFFNNTIVDVDPDKISGVFNSSIDKPSIKKVIRYLGGEPDIILAKNYAAPIYCKKLFLSTKIIYLASGCPHMMDLSKQSISAIEYLGIKNIIFNQELDCFNQSDFILPNSLIAKKLLIHNYGNSKKILEPIDTSFALNNVNIKNNKVYSSRFYDVAFICSNLDRAVKNFDLAKKILLDDKMFKYKKIIIGNNNLKINKENLFLKNLCSNKEIINILQNTKVVICTSFYDASPNIIKEAIMCGCTVVISQNCGWSEIYNPESVCLNFKDVNLWQNMIESQILKPKFIKLLSLDSFYEDLLDIIK